MIFYGDLMWLMGFIERDWKMDFTRLYDDYCNDL